MKQTVKLLSLVLIVTMFLVACSPAADSTGTPTEIQVTKADEGKSFSLNTGDSLVIVLESNPSTGYTWEVEPVDNAVLQLSGEAVFEADGEELGSPGKSTLTFDAVKAGTQTLTLIYHRPSETDVEPLETFTINVTVSGSASGDTQPAAESANPAAQYCEEQGYTSETRTTADGSQYGVCKFTSGSECDEWAYFRGECTDGQYSVAPTPEVAP